MSEKVITVGVAGSLMVEVLIKGLSWDAVRMTPEAFKQLFPNMGGAEALLKSGPVEVTLTMRRKKKAQA